MQKERFVGKEGRMSTILPPAADGLGKDKQAKLGNDQTFFTDISAHPKWEVVPGALHSGIANVFCLC